VRATGPTPISLKFTDFLLKILCRTLFFIEVY
jgi:hypothetical protein